MLSPAAEHRMKASVARAASLPEPAAPATPDRKSKPAIEPHHEPVFMGQFKADYHQMTHIKSRTRRKEAKRAAVEKYQQWLTDFMHRQVWEAREINMFVWLMLWHIDAGDWWRGLELARFALAYGMCSPKDFSRTLAETVCEEIAGGILKSGNAADHADLLAELSKQVGGHDMADQIAAKLHKAQGLAMLNSDPEQARAQLLKALELDSGAGVKRILKALDGNQRKPRSQPVNIQEFSLSGRAAATLANMTAPAFLRHAKKHPDKLPRVEIPLGKRTLYRFNPKHVRAYMTQHLINSEG